MRFKNILFILFFFFTISLIYSQSIRKNYREMTDNERVDLVNAFYQLRLGEDLIADLADFHSVFFDFDNGDGSAVDIHRNLPDEPENDIFLAWHRRQMFEVEQAMQDINENITIPYVDWLIDDAASSPVWDDDFMGQFDDDWNLGRTLGRVASLPSQQEVDNLMANGPDYYEFSDDFERGNVHAGAHNWIGGIMGGRSSPADPIFYLHHTFVDKIWHDWEEIYQSSVFIRTNMLRYDGTYTFDSETLPSVNPNDMINSRNLGVFYANDELAILDNYEVRNIYRSLEKFYYQYTIQAQEAFIVPANGNCHIESVNEIILRPGFLAESGSNFIASIDNTDQRKTGINKIVRNQIPFDHNESDLINVYGSVEKYDVEGQLTSIYPNPFQTELSIENLVEGEGYEVSIYSAIGNMIYQTNTEVVTSTRSIVIDGLQNLKPGIYFIVFNRLNSIIKYRRKIIKI